MSAEIGAVAEQAIRCEITSKTVEIIVLVSGARDCSAPPSERSSQQ